MYIRSDIDMDLKTGNIVDGLKTYFVVKDTANFSIARVVVASCKISDFSACGRAVFETRKQLRQDFPHGKYTIETLTATDIALPSTLDKSLIHNIVIP